MKTLTWLVLLVITSFLLLITLSTTFVIVENSPLWLGFIISGLITISTNWRGWGYPFGRGKFKIGEKANLTQVTSGIVSFIYGLCTGALAALFIGITWGTLPGGLIGGLIGGIVGWGIGVFVAKQYDSWFGEALKFAVPFLIAGLELGTMAIAIGGDEVGVISIVFIVVGGMAGVVMGTIRWQRKTVALE